MMQSPTRKPQQEVLHSQQTPETFSTRLSNKLSDGITGTGIGLSISRELARTHGGELSIEATERGASFKLELETKDEA